MDLDESMLSDLTCDHDYRVDKKYFYRVTSEHSATAHHSISCGSPHLFQAPCEFLDSYVTREVIEERFQEHNKWPTPFVAVFDNFAEAFRRAYHLHLSGHGALLIVRIDASDLNRTIQLRSEPGEDSLIPVWKGATGSDNGWLCVAEIGPLLGVDTRYTRNSEWLACGNIPSFRFSAAWPVIGEKLFFEEHEGEDLVELFIDICGRMPDHIRQHVNPSHYTYDWDNEVFVETRLCEKKPLQVQGGFASSAIGLGVAASQFTRPTMFGYAGFLRGMIVMD